MSWIKVILDERMCDMTEITEQILACDDEELIDAWREISGLYFDFGHEELFEVCTCDDYEDILNAGKAIINKINSAEQ